MTNENTIQATQQLYVKKTARGVRVWLEDLADGSRHIDCGFAKGNRYNSTFEAGRITITAAPDGKKVVSGKAKAIIDISRKSLDGFEIGDELVALYSAGQIVIVKTGA